MSRVSRPVAEYVAPGVDEAHVGVEGGRRLRVAVRVPGRGAHLVAAGVGGRDDGEQDCEEEERALHVCNAVVEILSVAKEKETNQSFVLLWPLVIVSGWDHLDLGGCVVLFLLLLLLLFLPLFLLAILMLLSLLLLLLLLLLVRLQLLLPLIHMLYSVTL